MRVAGLPPGETFALSAFLSALGPSPLWLELDNCGGNVVVDGAEMHPRDLLRPAAPPYVSIVDCAHVSFNYSTLIGVRVRGNSNVRFTRCRIEGSSEPPLPFGTIGTPALTMRGGDVTLAWSSVLGGRTDGSVGRTNGPQLGIDMQGGRLRITGTADPLRNHVSCGVSFNPSAQPTETWAIRSDGGEVEIGPDIPLNPGIAHDPFTGSSSRKERAVPFVICRRVLPGAVLDPIVYATPGSTAALWLGLPVARPLPTPFGELWLDLGAALGVGAAVVPATGTWTVQVPVPQAVPVGTALALQAAVLDGCRIELSVPTELVLAFFQCCPP
jgi:hypothetical protein